MNEDNRWSSEAYPSSYREDINRSIGFAGLDVDIFTRGKADNLVELLDVHLPGGAARASGLDIGCGIGIMHPLLAPRLAHLAGADVSAEAIHTARGRNPAVDYRTYGGSRLPYPDASFDFASTVCVMHHVPPPNWPAFVAEAWRVTKPGGVFAVYEHNPINPLTKVAVWRCPFDHDAVLLRAAGVIALLEAQGFGIEALQYLFFVPARGGWARRVDRALRWLPLGAQYVVVARRPL